jgi:ring-1,2-phenylacetyl-CoA epoxidase subunit PaaE
MILHLQYVGRFFHSVYSQGRGAFGRIEQSVNFVLNNKHKELEFDKFYLADRRHDQYRFGCFERENESAIKFELLFEFK